MTSYAPAALLPLAQRTGRWVIKQVHEQDCLYTTNLGSSIRLISHGSNELQVDVLDNGQPAFASQIYAWRIDNGPWHRIPAAQHHLSVSLPDRQHHLVEVSCAGNTDLDQVWHGNQGFAITSIHSTGQVEPAAPRPVVNFIGDSITAGCWVGGKHAAIDYRPESNYVGLACDQVGVDGVRIAYSAAGVLRPGTGGVPVATDFLPRIDATTKWFPNAPQLTVVNLGVNDRRFSAAEFQPAYEKFIGQVQATFPNCPLYLMVPFSQTFRSEILTTARRYGTGVIETTGWCHDYTDGLHPNQRGAVMAGHHLAYVLKKLITKEAW